MANVTITQLPAAGVITGSELVPIVQNGQTVRTTTGAIAASPSQTQTFLTLNQEPSLPNSRFLQGGTGIGLTDNGAQSYLQIVLNGASGSLEAASNGVIVKTGSASVINRSIAVSGDGLSITNGNGIAGNPTIALTGIALAMAQVSGTGFLAVVGGTTIAGRELFGTAQQINVTDGNGTNSPVFSLAPNTVIPGTGAITIPVGTTAQRPVGQDGMIRYNTDSNSYEVYDSGSWTSLPAGAVTLVNTGTGLTGGPITSSGTISIANTGVLPATYGTAAAAPQIVVNAQGQITSATEVMISPAAIGAVASVTGTANEIDVVGTTNVVLSLPTNMTFTGKTVTGGTFDMVAATVNSIPVVTEDAVQTLTNKTISGNNNTLSDIGNASLTNSTIGFTYSNGITGSASVALGSSNAMSLSNVPNAALQNSSLTIGSTSVSLGGTATSLAGLTTVTVTQAPTAALQLATKQYVDDAVSTGITIHTPVRVETPSALTATYTPGGTSVTVTDITGTDTLTFSSSPSLSVNDQIVFSSSSNGIVAGTAYYVFSVPAANQVTLSLSYNGPKTTFTNGTGLTIGGLVNAGVGATLTNAGAKAALQIDGVTLSVTNRVLVYNQANAYENGVYTVTTVGTPDPGGTDWVLTRATTEDKYQPDSINGIGQGDYFFVQEGNTGAGESYVLTTANPLIIGTTNLTFTQFSASQVYSAGTGLTLSGTQFSITNTGVVANTYGSASSVPTIAINAQGQITSASNTSIAIAATQITSGTIGSSLISGSYTGITGVGTLTAGTWNANAIAAAYGGTGQTSYAAGDLLYASGATTLSKLALGTQGYVLKAGASAPEWGVISGGTF